MIDNAGDTITETVNEGDDFVFSTVSYTLGDNISVSLSGEDEHELRGYWEGLTAGGTVTVPMEKAPWGDVFGMCADKFGINWLLNVNSNPPQGA